MLKEKRFSLSIKVELAKKLEMERKIFSNEIDQIELSTQSNSFDVDAYLFSFFLVEAHGVVFVNRAEVKIREKNFN